MELTVQGTVQGVGFRPFVYRLARDFKIGGTIANTSQGVVIQAEGLTLDLDNFLQQGINETTPLKQTIEQLGELLSGRKDEAEIGTAAETKDHVEKFVSTTFTG